MVMSPRRSASAQMMARVPTLMLLLLLDAVCVDVDAILCSLCRGSVESNGSEPGRAAQQQRLEMDQLQSLLFAMSFMLLFAQASRLESIRVSTKEVARIQQSVKGLLLLLDKF